jgi:hypothetical protein
LNCDDMDRNGEQRKAVTEPRPQVLDRCTSIEFGPRLRRWP